MRVTEAAVVRAGLGDRLCDQVVAVTAVTASVSVTRPRAQSDMAACRTALGARRDGAATGTDVFRSAGLLFIAHKL